MSKKINNNNNIINNEQNRPNDNDSKTNDVNNYNAEYGAELAPNNTSVTNERKYNDTFTGSSIIGYLAILSSVISFFAYPVTFGIIGVILGVIAVTSNAKTLGYWAIGLGAITSIASLFFRIAVLSFILNLFR